MRSAETGSTTPKTPAAPGSASQTPHGSGAAAAGISAVTLGAFRSARRESNDPAESLLAMHEVLLEIGDGAANSTATIGHWNAPASTFRWVTAGDEPPFRITADGQIKPLDGHLHPPLGSQTSLTNSTPTKPTSTRPNDSSLSDSFTHPTDGLGLPAITTRSR